MALLQCLPTDHLMILWREPVFGSTAPIRQAGLIEWNSVDAIVVKETGANEAFLGEPLGRID
jgi:hypothetical protein